MKSKLADQQQKSFFGRKSFAFCFGCAFEVIV